MGFNRKIDFLWSSFHPYKPHAVLLLLVLVLSAISEALSLGMIIPFLRVIIGDNSSSLDTSWFLSFINRILIYIFSENHKFYGLCSIILFLFLIKSILSIIKIGFSVFFSNSLREYWSCNVLNKYIFSNYSDIISHKKGVLLNNLINEPLYASKALKFLVNYIARAIIAVFLFLTMVLVNWKITFAITISVGLIFFMLSNISKKYSANIGRIRINLDQSIHSQAEEILNGIRQVKIYSSEVKVYNEFKQIINRLMRVITKFSIISGLPLPIGETFLVLALVSTLLYLDNLKNGYVVVFLPTISFYLLICYRQFSLFSYLFSERMSLISFLPSLKLIQKMCNDENVYKRKYIKGDIIHHLEGDIVFDNVTFAYPGTTPVLKNVNLCIKKGEVTAIVGASGSGKSTILDLIIGLQNNYSGNITINNKELRSINILSWRKIIGFVSQDAFIFNTTVTENILYGNQYASKKSIKDAAKKAGAFAFIKNMPKEFDTILGDRGMAISGGERQRIAIARALMREPELYIFDEATSSLDQETEAEVLKSIENIREGKTIIIVTHRLSSIRNVDMIYCLENGFVKETGAYDNFIKKKAIIKS